MASDIGGRDPLSRQNALRPYYHRPELVFHDGVPGLEVSKYGGGAPRLSYGAASRADSPLADLDYADYFEFPNTTEVMRTVTSAMLMRYTSTLFAQPFEVAKMILQCGKYERPGSPAGGTKKQIAKGDKPARRSRIDDIDTFEVDIEEQDDEEVDYFSTAGESRKVAKPRHQQNHTRTNSVTSSASSEESNSGSGGRRKPYGRSGLRNTSSPIPEIYQISTHRPHLLGAMGALWTKDGPWGVWKGSNISFIQNLAVGTIDSWLSAFIAAILGISDPSVVDIIDSSHPLVSLFASVTATTITALLISPLDIVRTKLILTPSDAQPRSVVASLQCLPSLTCPQHLLLPTALLAAVPKLIRRGTPYFLRTRWGIEQYTSPLAFSFYSFASATAELFIRLPLETVLRRGQLAYVGVKKTVVAAGEYDGILGSMWNILSNEDNGETGLEGLWRGWRVGMLGILGTWGINRIRSRTDYVVREERF
ncbi:mitochondrial carrier domain-containing protein [Kockiozyma suomiensis]|uniref:mitochondrial carrier domain-containing protein n=1 Tax=Kockiozyma suomiensis TaxID=1337062 RepID=UPI0033437A14